MTQQVAVYCQPSLRNFLYSNDIEYREINNELYVLLDDVEYKNGNHPDQNGIWEDPDIQFCNHYGIDYEQVNCIELVD